MKLTAIKAVRYGGKRYQPGDQFEAEGRWADLMQRAGIARLSEGGEAPRRGRGRPKGSSNKVVTHDTQIVPSTDLVIRSEDEGADSQDDE